MILTDMLAKIEFNQLLTIGSIVISAFALIWRLSKFVSGIENSLNNVSAKIGELTDTLKNLKGVVEEVDSRVANLHTRVTVLEEMADND